MTQQEALEKIALAIKVANNKDIKVSPETDLLAEKLLDSLDAMIFIMELENEFDKRFPEDINLADAGYYKVENLLKFFLS